MSNHTNAEYLKALADGKLLQYTYLKVEECDILKGFWIDLVTEEWGGVNSAAANQLITGSGDGFSFRIKE